jgi:DNA-binding NarL/FixJ family response regulator
METVERDNTIKPINVLVAGNNPIEVAQVLDKLYGISLFKVVGEIAFDLRSTLDRLIYFKPDFILIDDNFEKGQLAQTIHRLSIGRKTKDVPLAILKNSNYEESVLSCISSNISDYILKQNLSSDSLYNLLKNVLKFRRTQRYLYQGYKRRKQNSS